MADEIRQRLIARGFQQAEQTDFEETVLDSKARFDAVVSKYAGSRATEIEPTDKRELFDCIGQLKLLAREREKDVGINPALEQAASLRNEMITYVASFSNVYIRSERLRN